MIFFNKYPSAIKIGKNSLNFYINGEQKNLALSSDAVSDSDIVNPQKYEKLVEDFIVTEKIRKQKFILILSEEIVFQKSIPPEDSKILDERLTDFVSMIPLESEKLVKKSIQVGDNIQLFAVNKYLFEKIIIILEKFNFEVVAVVPLSLFSSDNEINQDLIKNIFKETELFKKANFLSDDFTQNNTNQNKMIFAVMLFLLMIILIMGFLLISTYTNLSLPFLSLKKETKLTQVVLKTSPSISTESATDRDSTQSAALDKDQLKATILNGTGIAGQAAKIKDLLIELGLSKIETGNAEETEITDTVVMFSHAVAANLQDEIIDLLKENFASVSAQENSASPSADILITTGKPKSTP